MIKFTVFMYKLLVTTIFLLCVQLIFAQKFLAIDSRVSSKRWKFSEGDIIMLKLENKELLVGQITQLNDSSFYLGSKLLPLKNIKSIQLRGHRYGLNLLTKVSLLAGLGYFSIDTFNRLINSDDPLVYEGTIITGASFLGVALISDLLNRKTIRIKEKSQIKILDLSI